MAPYKEAIMHAQTFRTANHGLLGGLTRGWEVWLEAMGRTQDLSAPWRDEKAAQAHVKAWRGRHPGPAESSVATK